MPAASDFLQFFRGQLFQTPKLPSASLGGQTIVITGANSGLGYESAKHLRKMGVSTLILGCRSAQKGEEAKDTIIKEIPNGGEIQVWQLDMDNYDSVKSFASRLNEMSRLDALLLNAGVFTQHFTPVAGSESTLVVNVIATFLLAYLALPVLQRSAKANGKPSRMVVTGSAVHGFFDPKELIEAPPNKVFSNLGDPHLADMGNRYNMSKLLVMMGVRKISEVTNPNEVIINCPGPGLCITPLFEDEHGGAIGRFMINRIGRKPEVGARCITSAAVAGPETHGQYLSECQVKRVSVWLRSQQGAQVEKKVWKDLLYLLHSIDPTVDG